jgi:hypothetical protein
MAKRYVTALLFGFGVAFFLSERYFEQLESNSISALLSEDSTGHLVEKLDAIENYKKVIHKRLRVVNCETKFSHHRQTISQAKNFVAKATVSVSNSELYLERLLESVICHSMFLWLELKVLDTVFLAAFGSSLCKRFPS